MKWGIYRIGPISLLGMAMIGLIIANENRRSVIIKQNKGIAQKASYELQELQNLGFTDRDVAVKSLREQAQAASSLLDAAQTKWWMISLKTDRYAANQAKVRRLLSLNRKLLKSYRQDLSDLRRFGFPENDPSVRFSRTKVAQIVVELAHLNRECSHVSKPQDALGKDQKSLLAQMVALNKESIDRYKAEIVNYLERGFNLHDKKIQDIRSKMSAKIAENGLLERRLYK